MFQWRLKFAFKLNEKGYEVGKSIINNEELAVGLKHSKLADQLLGEHNVGAKTISSPTNEDVNAVRGEGTH